MIIDCHNDSLTAFRAGQEVRGPGSCGHLDLARLRAGRVDLAFFACFVEPASQIVATHRTLALIDTFWQMVEENPTLVFPVMGKQDLKLLGHGRTGCLLSMEGGEGLGGDVGLLRCFFRLGVRAITLTWNNRNLLGDGVGEQGTRSRLTNFGVAVIEQMNELGMVVDLAHLSERCFYHVLECSTAPVLVSHSNARALCDHPRNLSDEQICAVGERGGLVAVTFVSPFLVKGRAAQVHDVVDHIEHIAALIGVDGVAIGSDFDGTDELAAELYDVAQMPRLRRELGKRFSALEVEKIMGGNVLRLLQQVLP